MSGLISSIRVNYPAPHKLGNVSDFCGSREEAEFAAFAVIEDAVWGKA